MHNEKLNLKLLIFTEDLEVGDMVFENAEHELTDLFIFNM